MAPVAFEIISGDGNMVFVFTPAEDGLGDAHAAVYAITNNERRPVYAAKDLSSFAYEGDFYFSDDMMHFARVFPGYGMPAFEVFSYGVRTRVVIRSDFIKDYTGIEAESSIGPFYTVTWGIEEYSPQGTIITIHTDEDSSVIFDLATAKFIWENDSQIHNESPSEIIPPTVPQPLNSYIIIDEIPPEASSAPISQTQNPPVIFFTVTGAAAVSIAVGVLLWKRREK